MKPWAKWSVWLAMATLHMIFGRLQKFQDPDTVRLCQEWAVFFSIKINSNRSNPCISHAAMNKLISCKLLLLRVINCDYYHCWFSTPSPWRPTSQHSLLRTLLRCLTRQSVPFHFTLQHNIQKLDETWWNDIQISDGWLTWSIVKDTHTTVMTV